MQNKTFSRILCLALAIVMVCTVFLFGCQGDEAKTTQGQQNATQGGQQQTQTEADTSTIYDAEVKDLQGHEFVFYTRNTTSVHLNHIEVYAEEPNGDKVNDAVFKRNAQLQTTYNCKISEIRDNDVAAVVREPLITGEYICDFLFIRATDARGLSKNNLLVDVATLENVDLTKEWWDQDALKGLNMAGKTFFLTGDGCTIDDRWALSMFFNLELVEAAFPEANLYQEVRDGKWTNARMLEIMQATAADMDGDGQVATYQKDIYGYMAGNVLGNWAHVAASGGYVTEIVDGNLEIPISPSRELLDIWADLRPLITSPLRFSVDNLPSGNIFRGGLATFYAVNTGALLNWGSQKFHLGVLPYPKRNEEQKEYITTMNFSVGGYCIPITVNNDVAKDYEKAGFASGAEMCGYFLEAYSYYSRDTLTPAFFDQVLAKQIAMDADSIEMVAIAIENRQYDPVVGYNFGGMRTLFAECGGFSDQPGTDINYDNFTAKYRERVSKAREAVEDYLTFVNADEATA